jgi:predicted dehydrogenase
MTVRVGFVGYRFMGDAHANALERLSMFFPEAPRTDRHVLVGRDETALANAAEQLGFSTTATDWRAVLSEVDVLYVLTPNAVHPEPSIEALERGVHVLCEKPLAPTLEGAEEMVEAARESSALAATAFNYRFVPALQYAKRLIDDGEIGEPRQFRAHYLQDWLVDTEEPWSWRNDREMAGSGALGDLGAHTFDLARYLVGDLERISGHLQTFVEERPVEDGDGTRPVTVDDAYSAQFSFENGALGTAEASRVAPGHKNDHSVAVHGSRGSVRFSLERLNELEVLRPGTRGYETVLVTDENDPYVEPWWPPGHVLGWEHAFVHENYEFLTAIEEGREYHPNFEDGLAAQRAIDGVQRSDETGEWVSL